MNKHWVLTQESFDALLTWLDPKRDEAGRKYEDIRRRLIKIFTCRRCFEPEDLTDETINRVAKKLPEIVETYSGEPVAYFYAVANNVHKEYLRRKPVCPPPPPMVDSEDIEREYACLENCIQTLSPLNRLLVIQYYQGNKAVKIENRKQLAQQLGIALNALRIRAHRVRLVLQECVQACVQQAQA